jgi:hypothetical protein
MRFADVSVYAAKRLCKNFGACASRCVPYVLVFIYFNCILIESQLQFLQILFRLVTSK